jgi:hypothetical protein
MLLLAFGSKIRIFFEGGDHLWPLRKNVISQKKKSTNIFAPDPQFLFYNLKVLELRHWEKTRAQKIED